MSNHRMVPKRSIKAFVNAALWGDFEACVDFLRGTDVYSVKILDREEVLRLKLAPNHADRLLQHVRACRLKQQPHARGGRQPSNKDDDCVLL